MDYYIAMPQTLEQRLEDLEKKVAELSAQNAAANADKKAWLRTFGLSRDDAGFDEMTRLGQEYRENLRDQSNGADS